MNEIQPLAQRGSQAASGATTRPADGSGSSRVATSARLTNFYPLYGAANDQVDAVIPVQPVLFQRVIPRYRLSTSETRDQGLGPMFADIPESPGIFPPAETRRAEAVTAAGARGRETAVSSQPRARAGAPAPEPWLGRRVDLFA